MSKSKLYALALLMTTAMGTSAQNTPESQMEKLSRGVVVIPAGSGTGRFISWRLLGTDNDETTFDVLRNGTAIRRNLLNKTNYVDQSGTASNRYQIVTKQNGTAVDTTDAVTSWANMYRQLTLDKPANAVNQKNYAYSYSPNDCSAADVDGDGEYEIIVKWDPTNSQDNGHAKTNPEEFTGNVILDCYKLDGTKLWRIDLGPNIRAGAHYTQFLVYDFDGDGKAELVCKTAPGSKDGAGNYVSEAATDEKIKTVNNTAKLANSSGHILSGAELLTVFNGETGNAINTIWYNPNRAGNMNQVGTYPSSKDFWGDNYGNRSERFLACVAYLDGADKNPSAVMCRGYYTRAYLWAVDFDGKELKTKWLHGSVSKTKVELTDANGTKTSKSYGTNTRPGSTGSNTMYGNGNHNLSVADVDGDGCDEIIYGSAAVNNDGTLLYAVGYGHGDAIHMTDLVPERPGLEVFDVHEESPYGWDLHDAATGEVLLSSTGESDNGRGFAADLDASNVGGEFCSSNDRAIRSATTGKEVGSGSTSVNFRMYWDGDLQDELLDDKKIDKWNGKGTRRLETLYNYGHSADCNSTKHTPNLVADLFGDWREEVVLWDSSDSTHLNIFTTNVESEFRVPTLMHDHVYRMGVAWQNAAYNQPPHLGYYLPNTFTTRYPKVTDGEFEQTVNIGDTIVDIQRKWMNCAAPSLIKSIAPDGTTTTGDAAEGFTYKMDRLQTMTFTLKGKPTMIGEYQFVMKSGANVVDKSEQYDTIRIHCVNPTAIEDITYNTSNAWVSVAGNDIDNQVRLNFNLKAAQNVNVSIYSTAGTQMFGRKYNVSGTMPVIISGLGSMTNGIYMLKVKSSEGTYSKKLIKR